MDFYGLNDIIEINFTRLLLVKSTSWKILFGSH